MNVDFNRILVFLSIFTSLGSSITFITTGLFKSPITEGWLLIVVSGVILTASYKFKDDLVITVSKVIFILTTFISIFYIVTSLLQSSLVTPVLFACYTVLLLGILYFTQQDESYIDYQLMRNSIIIFTLIFVIVLGIDVFSATTETSITLHDTVQQIDTDTYTVGTVTVSNSSFLPIKSMYPDSYETCIGGVTADQISRPELKERLLDTNILMFPDSRVEYDRTDNILVGSKTVSIELVAAELLQESELNVSELPIVKGDCSQQTYEEPTLIVNAE